MEKITITKVSIKFDLSDGRDLSYEYEKKHVFSRSWKSVWEFMQIISDAFSVDAFYVQQSIIEINQEDRKRLE